MRDREISRVRYIALYKKKIQAVFEACLRGRVFVCLLLFIVVVLIFFFFFVVVVVVVGLL
jgi:hypothetical protein